MSEKNYIIQAADECLNIIILLGAPEYLQLTELEIMKPLGLSKNRVYRMLKTLERKQLVRNRKGRWGLSPAIIMIADGFRRHLAKKRAELVEQEIEYLGGQSLALN